jgi:hypothetical protein
VVDDVAQLLRDTQSCCPVPVLNNVQIDPQLWASSHRMGGLRLICDDDYLAKTKRYTMVQNHEEGDLNRCYGLELQFDMHRRLHLRENQAPFNMAPSKVIITLAINDQPELDALQKIYRDWRGIVKKLLNGTIIEANACSNFVLPELEHVRSGHPIPTLDVMLNLPPREGFSYQLELGFEWRHDSDWEICQTSFLALAVLFTCIQKATAFPRSRKEHLLDYWLASEKYKK